MTLGEVILHYREEHHLSQRQFAIRCGLSNGYIAMIENNVNPATGKPLNVGIEALGAIASVMHMTTDELVRMTDGNTPVSLKSGTDDVAAPDETYVQIKDSGIRLLAVDSDNLSEANKRLIESVIKPLIDKLKKQEEGSNDNDNDRSRL